MARPARRRRYRGRVGRLQKERARVGGGVFALLALIVVALFALLIVGIVGIINPFGT
ncbi:hypothetical protein BH10ACT3_BH10ACT3_12450 [soil metagenome]